MKSIRPVAATGLRCRPIRNVVGGRLGVGELDLRVRGLELHFDERLREAGADHGATVSAAAGIHRLNGAYAQGFNRTLVPVQ